MKFLALLMMMAGVPAGAGGLTDVIMAPGVFAGAQPGQILRYSHERRMPGIPAGTTLPGSGKGLATPKAVVGGNVEIVVADGAQGRELVLTRLEDNHNSPVGSFPAAGPNPLLLFFLENVVRSVSVYSGGSPFYLRNRLRDALAGADLPPASGGTSDVTLRPFEHDPHGASLGEFSALTLTLRFDPALPSRLIELKADTGSAPGGYSETLRLIPEE